MPVEENREIARRFGQVWTAGRLEVVDALAAPDLVVDYTGLPEPIRGAAAFKQYLARQWYAGLPDVRWTAEELLADGDRVAVRWTCRGTHTGALLGLPPTGKPVELQGITLYRIAGGRVAEERGISNLLGFLQQLGALPERAPTGG